MAPSITLLISKRRISTFLPPAACRAFMQERLLGKADGASLGEAVLYFGCRRSDQDYLYGDLLEGWAASGSLTLFTAFSRQQVTLPHATSVRSSTSQN